MTSWHDLTEVYAVFDEAYQRKYVPSMAVGGNERESVRWSEVMQYGRQILTERTDPEVAVKVMEAAVKHDGLPSLPESFRCLREQLREHWDKGQLQEEDTDTTHEKLSNLLEWLDEELPPCIRTAAAHAETILAASERAELLQEILAEWQRLNQIIDERLGDNRPSLTEITAALQSCQQNGEHGRESLHTQTVARIKSPQALTDIVDVPRSSSYAPLWSNEQGPIIHPHSREEALGQLRMLATYFRQTEPLGPMAALLEVAVRWATMTFAEWLPEVIRDDRLLDDSHDLLGRLFAETRKEVEATE
jgi:type VI secretion system protein ImpA